MTDKPKFLLSILICTLPERIDSFNALIGLLHKQIQNEFPTAHFVQQTVGNGDHYYYRIAYPTIEIIACGDQKNLSIGKKRNLLLDQAQGEYCAFIDDDDSIYFTYIFEILNALKSKPDVCSLIGMITTDNENPKQFRHSIDYSAWYESNNVYYRNTNHLNCIKTDIARQVRFPEKNHGEDFYYSKALKESGLLKTEAKIDTVIYYYDYKTRKL